MPADDQRFEHLRLLATSDVHAHVFDFDYFADVKRRAHGLAALAGPIAALREEAASSNPPRHSFLFDNGDLVQGTPLASFLAEDDSGEAIAAFAEVIDALGYDALGLGNHDFDFGIPHLAAFARAATAPVLSSNLRLPAPADWLVPHLTFEAGSLTVGLLSVLPPRTLAWSYARLGDATEITNMVDAVEASARALRTAGADLVIALAHSGRGTDPDENALDAIAATRAVDAIIGGHTHHLHPDGATTETAVRGVPLVMPGYAGSHIGCIDLDVAQRDDGRWVVAGHVSRVIPAATPETPGPTAPLAVAHERTRAALDSVVSTTPVPLHSYFAQVTPTRMLALAAAAQADAIDAARQGTPESRLPLLSAVSPPRAGGRGGPRNYADIPAGPLRLRHAVELHIYDNLIWAVQVSGRDLQAWLEKSASAFHHLTPSHTGSLLDPSVPSFDFDVIHGLTYTIDPTQPVGARISGLRHGGLAVADDQQFLVAVNSYRACGGGDFPGLTPDRPVLRPDYPVREVVRRYLASGAAVDYDPPWRFSPEMAGHSAWFDTGTGAEKHLDEIADLSPRPLGVQENGFLRVELTF